MFYKYGLRILTMGFVLTLSLNPNAAQAHVKWFCAYNETGSPVILFNVLCQDFEQLVLLAMGMLFVGLLIEGSPIGRAMMRSLDRTTGLLRSNTELLIRIVTGGFFLSLALMPYFGMKSVLLTPELTTDITFVPWIQLVIALTMCSRRLLPLATLAIVTLFALAIQQYGIFHLMDYPIFLGLAAYLGCKGLEQLPPSVRPLDMLRWATSVTLMWAAIEKWAYPQWTDPLFISHPGLSLGLDIDFFMRAAGVVEFTLAFALLSTPLVRRVAAVILAAMFIAAIAEFGMIDAIGHSCIIVTMFAVLSDNERISLRRRNFLLTPLTYSATLATFLLGYYGLHSVMFGSILG
jgi:hypothetical protein